MIRAAAAGVVGLPQTRRAWGPSRRATLTWRQLDGTLGPTRQAQAHTAPLDGETSVLRLTACCCGARNLVRVDRSFWMRLVPTRRHYYCPLCRSNQFLSWRAVLRALEVAPAAPPPVRPREVEPVTRQMGDTAPETDATLPARFL
jgi:hypothetical protein